CTVPALQRLRASVGIGENVGIVAASSVSGRRGAGRQDQAKHKKTGKKRASYKTSMPCSDRHTFTLLCTVRRTRRPAWATHRDIDSLDEIINSFSRNYLATRFYPVLSDLLSSGFPGRL